MNGRAEMAWGDGEITLLHGDALTDWDLRSDRYIIVTDPPMDVHPDLLGSGHFIVHPHMLFEWLDASDESEGKGAPDHVSAWIRHSPGFVRDGFGHHWNAVLHYGPADLPTDLFIDDAPRETDHPAERGVGPMTDLLSALPDGVILDPFAGTGSTLLAARALGRRAVGIELDERWVEVACNRLRR